MITQENSKVNVKGGRYVGYKWFTRIQYKKYETDVEFFDDRVDFSQGSGFVNVKNKTLTSIKYKDIQSVTVKRKYSVPNVILAVLAVFGVLMTGVWCALILAALVVWVGSTAVTTVEYSNETYNIPTEFKSEAEELQSKINTAISQSR